jgi:hypothetical protein
MCRSKVHRIETRLPSTCNQQSYWLPQCRHFIKENLPTIQYNNPSVEYEIIKSPESAMKPLLTVSFGKLIDRVMFNSYVPDLTNTYHHGFALTLPALQLTNLPRQLNLPASSHYPSTSSLWKWQHRHFFFQPLYIDLSSLVAYRRTPYIWADTFSIQIYWRNCFSFNSSNPIECALIIILLFLHCNILRVLLLREDGSCNLGHAYNKYKQAAVIH